MSGIYIHIPFCKQACSYCDFYFLTRQELRQPFVDALLEEIRTYRNRPEALEKVTTIYIGGGTPSLLNPQQLESILKELNGVFAIEPVEVTLEMNPDDVTKPFLKSLQSLGISRASMGIQSFNPDLLRFMHRAHDPEEAKRALNLIAETGFPDYTADLIYGNLGQTEEMLLDDLDELLRFEPPHISAYSLTVEPKTRLGKQVELGRIDPPDDEKVFRHFEVVVQKTEEAGIRQYEVSNFAKPGREAIHNSNYWNHVNYIGLGPSAHSFWWESGTDEAVRRLNRPDLKQYLKSPGSGQSEEVLRLNELAEERLMLGLRTVSGVSLSNMSRKYGYELTEAQKDWIANQKEKGAVGCENGKLWLTSKGLAIADLLTVDLLSRGFG
ncbi:MAG: radical SAM family heme chaperone HemW [Bacteroidetes bacterium]|jgi:oxygen-independent coproporphyrinogen-3 oxidase|nr:radical SAM family heme chaperone HemW [Bacteroidota bacterium]